jgi:putative transcriptional regulator
MREVLAHVRGEITLPSRIVNIPQETDVRAIRARFKLSREKFAARFGLDHRAVQEWEQGRRRPDRATRVLLKIIEREPEAVERALAD